MGSDREKRVSTEGFGHGCGQEGDHNLMMSGECVPLSSFLRGTPDDVRGGTVMGEEVHIHGGNVGERMAEVASERNSL